MAKTESSRIEVNAKLKHIVDLMSKEKRKLSEQLKEQYERKHDLQRELFDRSIPYNRHTDAKEMLDITIDLIEDTALEISVWDLAREIVLNAMEE